MITTNHPLYEALKDIQDFKLKIAEFFKDKDVFPIKSKVELANALPCGLSLPCGDIEAGELVKLMTDADFPIKNPEDLAIKLSNKCVIEKKEKEEI
ncbi:MTH865 family protein [Methanothermococcus sp.]|uniref:MTH865 family protein n=1 Tax=Methanothermococcus sp. TaxID=2614238 RepID=UPI0025D6B163|nr:MTH865 family protein [Methanothermococcus sp.]